VISVWDLLDYKRCKRRLWLYKKAGIKKPNIGFRQGRRFHSVVHDMYQQLKSAWVREGIPGKVIETEVYLEYGGLSGRVDFLRKSEEGFMIHDEKYIEPPTEGVYESDKLQLNAYAYLAQLCGYAPVTKLFVIYNDLRPREIKPEPQTIPPLVEEVKSFLENMDILPEAEEEYKCETCSYFPLCQVLPRKGGIREDHLKIIRQKEMDVKLLSELEETLKAFRK